MLELLISVCLISDPTRCKDVSLIFPNENVTPMQCLMGAQPEIAKWIEAHPKWQPKRWKCRPAGMFADM